MERFDPLYEAVEEILGDNSSAEELSHMVAALEVRRDTFERELKSAESEESRKQWQAKLKELHKQIEVLRREQAISGFVEQSVRTAATRPRRMVNWGEDE